MTWIKRVGVALVAPLVAVVAAMIITSVVVAMSGNSPLEFWEIIFSRPADRVWVNIVNQSSMIFLSALAAAVGFRMNLFNIGVEGQYRIGTFVAAVVAGEAWLPGKANTALAILLAMVAGALWAGIAGLLRVTRGVSEVISTIMLNAIAGLLVGYLIGKVGVTTGVSTSTKTVPEESWVGGFKPFGDTPAELYGLILLAVVVGIAFHVLLNDTRFGFNLRATGMSESAAVASGVKVPRMVMNAMLISGGIAGLVGMPLLFGQDYAYGTTFQAGLGFSGIAIALLGRNNAVGIAFAALLWAYLEQQSNGLQIKADVSPELVNIIQGVILFAVVIAYELIRRADIRLEQARVARELAKQRDTATIEEGARA